MSDHEPTEQYEYEQQRDEEAGFLAHEAEQMYRFRTYDLECFICQHKLQATCEEAHRIGWVFNQYGSFCDRDAKFAIYGAGDRSSLRIRDASREVQAVAAGHTGSSSGVRGVRQV